MFSWYMPLTLKTKRVIFFKIKSNYWYRTHNYGIKIINSVREALKLDDSNKKNLWWDALMDEMRNVRLSFKYLKVM